VIPKKVRIICKGAFTDCPSIEEVRFVSPSELSEIHSFQNCKFRAIQIPSSVVLIGPDAFANCTNLANVAFEDPCQVREIFGFQRCGFSEFHIPTSVILTGSKAFTSCSSLVRVHFELPAQIAKLQGFRACSLTELDIPKSVREIGSSAFASCTSLSTVRFAEDSRVTEIHGFRACGINQLDIPRSVTIIGRTAFQDCHNLITVRVLTDGRLVTVEGFHGTPFVGLGTPSVQSSPVPRKGWVQLSKPWIQLKRSQLETDLCPRGSCAPRIPELKITTVTTPSSPVKSSPFTVSFQFAPEGYDLPRPFNPAKSRVLFHTAGILGAASWDFTIEQMAAFLMTLPNCIDATEPAPCKSPKYSLSSRLACKTCGTDLIVIGIDDRTVCHMDLVSSCECLSSLWHTSPDVFPALQCRDRVLACKQPMKGGQRRPAKNPRQRRFSMDCAAAWGQLRRLGFFPRNRCLKKLARAIFKNSDKFHLASEEHDWYNHVRLSPSGLRDLNAQRGGYTDPHTFIHRLAQSGLVRILQGETSGDTGLQYEEKDVLSLAWIARWAASAYEQANYIQLDCSFDGSDPYVYCVPQAIIRNEAIPLGFIIAPSETADIYELFYEGLDELFQKPTPRKPILCDEGPGIIAFAHRRNLLHFFCHRHLIQKFSANAPLGILAARVLRIPTYQQFLAHLPEALAELHFLLFQNVITLDEHSRFLHFLGQDGTPYIHGIWSRSRWGVSTCSNHAERFHRTVNKRTAGLSSLLHRLSRILDAINEKFDRYLSGCRRQLKFVLRQLKARHASPVKSCLAPRCCAFRAMMMARFELTSFPCKHQVAFFVLPNSVPAHIKLMERAFCKIDIIGQRTEWNPDKSKRQASASRAAARTDLRAPKDLPIEDVPYIAELARELVVLLGDKRSLKHLLLFEIVKVFSEIPKVIQDSRFRARFRTVSWIWAMNTRTGPTQPYSVWMAEAMANSAFFSPEHQLFVPEEQDSTESDFLA
jgi:hypothetical protein